MGGVYISRASLAGGHWGDQRKIRAFSERRSGPGQKF